MEIAAPMVEFGKTKMGPNNWICWPRQFGQLDLPEEMEKMKWNNSNNDN